MTIKLKFYWQLSLTRFRSLDLFIKAFAIISLSSILLIELVLKSFQATYIIQYNFGIIWLNLCYSYFSAFLFYYLVVFIPQENKKLHSTNIVYTAIHNTNYFVKLILLNLKQEFEKVNNISIEDGTITGEEISRIFENINPKEPITVIFYGHLKFADKFQFIDYFIKLIIRYTQEALIFNDIINKEILNNICTIRSIANEILTMNESNIDKLHFNYYYSYFIDLNGECVLMMNNYKQFEEKYHPLLTKIFFEKRERTEKLFEPRLISKE